MERSITNWKLAFVAELGRLARSAMWIFLVCFVVLLLIHAGLAWISPHTENPPLVLESTPSWPFWPATAAKAIMIAWVFSGSGFDKPFGFVMKIIVMVAVGSVFAAYMLAAESRNPWLTVPAIIMLAVAVETGLIWRWAVNWKAQAAFKQPEPVSSRAAG